MIENYEEGTENVSAAVITKEEVEHRIDDWLIRLRHLFEETRRWALENGWLIEDSSNSLMDEELMRRFKVSPQHQPTLRLNRKEGGYALFKPKGLWVVGANGRVDLYTSKGVFILVDQAGRYEAPRWTLFRMPERRGGVPFTPDLLLSLV